MLSLLPYKGQIQNLTQTGEERTCISIVEKLNRLLNYSTAHEGQKI